MRSIRVSLFAGVMLLGGCSEPREPLEGFQESDVEIVNEGSATGTTRQVVAPGDSLTAPMTATDFDTTTDLDMISDEQLPVEALDGASEENRAPAQRTLADRIRQPEAGSREPSRTHPPSTATSMSQPAPEPRPTAPRPPSSDRPTPPPRPSPSEEPAEPKRQPREDESAEHLEPAEEPAQGEPEPPPIIDETEPPPDEGTGSERS